MSSTLIPSQDLVPSVSSRVVTIDATSMLEATPDGEHWVDFILPQDLHVAADNKIIMAGSERVTLNAGKGSIRLPTYDPDAKTVDGSSDWVILVKKSWTGKSCGHGRGCGCGGAYAIRVPVGTSSISLADLPAVRTLTPRERLYAITGASVTVTEGGSWGASLDLSGGILNLGLTVPPGGVAWYKGRLADGTDLDTLDSGSESGVYQLGAGGSYLNIPSIVAGNSAMLKVDSAGTAGVQEIHIYASNQVWRRRMNNSVTNPRGWTAWERVDLTRAELDGIQDLAWGKGSLPPTDWNKFYDDGFYVIAPFGGHENTPPGITSGSGFLTVGSNSTGTWGFQDCVTYGTSPQRWWRTSRDTLGNWNAWERVTGGESAPAPASVADYGLRHALLAGDFRDRIGVRSIPGKAVVVFRFDHYLNVYRDQIRPLMTSRGLPATIAMNSRTWDQAQNNQVTPAEADGWADVEFCNHGAHHSDAETSAELHDTIAVGQAELQDQLPNHAIDGFIVPGVGGTEYGGWGTGSSLTSFADYEAGRLILGHHAYSTGSIGSVYRTMDGQLRQGLRRVTIEGQTFATVKTVIDNAVSQASAVTLMMHPNNLDSSTGITTQTLTDIFDYVQSLVANGTVEVMTLGESLLADSRTTTG